MSRAKQQTFEVAVAGGDPPAKMTSPSDRRLGRYRLCFEIAAGGMATVYLARTDGHAGFDKMVALKRIHPHLAKEQNFVQMFLDEARIAARINHPNVCNVFDFGESNGAYYIAMEYLAGEPLSRLLKAIWLRPDHKDSPKLAAYSARIIADACEGLHAAHELRDANGELLHVVHRDVSPHNLFITYDGSVRVVDFGIASARNRLHHTTTGEVKGKFAYMAPEQLRGKQVDRRADVWSLGVVLWEMVTMKRLFRRDTEMETIFAVASDSIPRPSTVRRSIPSDLEDIIMKALTRDPDQRYPTARDFARELLKFLAKRGELIGPADLAEWMDNLFPDGATRKRELMEIARHLEDEADPERVEADPATEGTGSDVLSSVRSSLLQTMSELERGQLGQRPKWKMMLAVGAAAVASIVIAVFAATMDQWREQKNTSPGIGAVGPQDSKTIPKKLPSENEPSKRGTAVPVRAHAEPVDTRPSVVKPISSETTHAPERHRDRQPTKRTPTKPPQREPQPRKPKEEPAEQQQPTATSGSGIVNVVTPGGWAYVLEGGQRLGQTPARITLPAGKHVLEIRPFGEPPAKRVNVNVTPDGVARVSVRIGD